MWSVKNKKDFDTEGNIEKLKDAVDHGEYVSENNYCNHVKYTDCSGGYKKEVQTIPLLKSCGVGSLVDPVALFSAIEEYFSMEKTASERTEAKGATNDDKITAHGFDTKTSFRRNSKYL